MENTSFNNLENNRGREAPFEFKNLLSEMFSSFSNQNPSRSPLEQGNTIVKEASKAAFPSSPPSTPNPSSSHNMISFGNPAESNFLGDDEQDYDMMSVEKVMSLSSSSTSMAKRICRSPLQSQDHLLAERKRRERFTQLFAALAKSIPDLKKLDKASILEDAIKYIEQLQERIRDLEEGTKQNLNIESTVTLKQPLAATSDDNTSLTKNSDESKPENEIKVQFVDKNVLIGIHCSKTRRSILSIIAGTMEKLRLTIHNIRVTPCNHTALNISIFSEVDQDVDISVQDVEKAFELAFLSTPNMAD